MEIVQYEKLCVVKNPAFVVARWPKCDGFKQVF